MTALALVGAGAKLGSTVANSVAQNKITAARDAAIAKNTALQAGFDQQIAGQQADALKPYAGFDTQNTANASSLGAMFNSGNIGTATGPNAPVDLMPGSHSAIVNNEAGKQAAEVAQFAGQQGAALGKLQAAGNTLFDANMNRARDTSRIATLDSFKRGQAAVLPYQLDAANQAGTGWKFAGDLLNGAGSIGIMAGMGGANPLATGGGYATGSTATGGLANMFGSNFLNGGL